MHPTLSTSKQDAGLAPASQLHPQVGSLSKVNTLLHAICLLVNSIRTSVLFLRLDEMLTTTQFERMAAALDPRFVANDEPNEADETDEDEEADEPGYCSACNGSGEGSYDGSVCRSCKGRGE
jgi:hypothetical protein